MLRALLSIAACAACVTLASAQERAYFVAYDHHMEEPGSLELSLNPVFGHPEGGNAFAAAWLEVEYGLAGWWTSELYLTGQTTRDESTLFTGWRFENRFRILDGDRPVNPVLYVEYEDGPGAAKTVQEVVGFDNQEDLAAPNAESSQRTEQEVELKLILGSDVGGWNVSENAIAVKSLHGEPWEFGYALGASRPLALAASPAPCRFCLENFRVGAELYGGLGEQGNLTLSGTSHYLAPVVSWEVGKATTLRLSPAFGLTSSSAPLLLRIGFTYEFGNVGPRIGGWR